MKSTKYKYTYEYLAGIRKQVLGLQRKQDELYAFAVKSTELADTDELFDYIFNKGELPEIYESR